ncbi:MAG: flagellar motor protein MotB [Mariniblastus sp.]
MEREKKLPEPKGDIPAWFMTYSDVITLLMTFFILLLTFSTTEPERFEKTISTIFSNGSATGVAGKKIKHNDHDSFLNRLRVPAARIAIRGATMPPILRQPATETWGNGLKSLTDEEAEQNELTSHAFEIPLALLFDSEDQLTFRGREICGMLSQQLQDLPFRASLQFSNKADTDRLSIVMDYLFHTEMTRPGQVAMTLMRQGEVANSNLRIVIERFTPNAQSGYASGLRK